MTIPKFLLLIAAIVATAFPGLHAQEQAVFEFRVGKEKTLQRVVIELFPDAAPQTVENFRTLVRKGFYKKHAIHRAIPNYLVQLGDPKSRRKDRSAVGTSGPGYTIPAEISRPHVTGAVAMARLPDTINPAKVSNGSQFYIMLTNAPELNNYSTVFGQVVEGLDFLKEVSGKATDTNDYPLERVVVRSTKLVSPATAEEN